MNNEIHYTGCPVCGNGQIQNVFVAKDFMVSKQDFAIWQCRACSLRFTQDVPNEAVIAPYYKSETYISHTNTSEGIINKLYRMVRKHTIAAKRRLVYKQTGLSKGSILDIGSGVGSFVAEMKKQGWDAMGVEPDADARAVAKHQQLVELQPMDFLYNLPTEKFDAITLWHVLEHVHEWKKLLEQCKKILKPTGVLIIAVPNYTSKDAAIYKEYWAAYDVPRHLYHFTPMSMEQLAAANNWRLITCKPMWYDSIYVSLLSSRYKYGNTRYLSAIINGLRSNIEAIKNPRNCSSVIYVLKKNINASLV